MPFETRPLHKKDLWSVVILFALAMSAFFWASHYGLNWMREDWIALLRAKSCDPFDCWPVDQHTRPIMGLMYEFQYRVLQNHPAVIIFYLNAALGITAALLYSALRLRTTRRIAFVVAVFWVVFPTHTALQHWPSVTHSVTSLMLACAACFLFMRNQAWWGFAFAVTSILVYESTFPVLWLGIFLLQYFGITHMSLRTQRVQLLTIFLLGATTALLSFGTREQQLIHPVVVLCSIFAFGHRFSAPVGALIVVGIIICTITCYGAGKRFFHLVRAHGFRRGARDLRAQLATETWLILVGIIIAVVGTIPFATTGFDRMFIAGLGDRATQITGIGSAMIWAGMLLIVAKQFHNAVVQKRLFATLSTVVVLLTIPRTIEMHANYGHVTHLTHQTVEKLWESSTKEANTTVEMPWIENDDERHLAMSQNAEVTLSARVHEPPFRIVITNRPAREIDWKPDSVRKRLRTFFSGN